MNRPLAAVGVLALGAALVTAAGFTPVAVAVVATEIAVLGVATAALVTAVGLLVSVNVTDTDTHGHPDSPIASGAFGPHRPVYRKRIGAAVENAIEKPEVGEERNRRMRRAVARNRARKRATELVIAEIQQTEGIEYSAARRRVREGTWTDDPRARAFLSDSVSLPWQYRLVDWFTGERERRQVLATLEAVEELLRDDGLTSEDGNSHSERLRADGLTEGT